MDFRHQIYELKGRFQPESLNKTESVKHIVFLGLYVVWVMYRLSLACGLIPVNKCLSVCLKFWHFTVMFNNPSRRNHKRKGHIKPFSTKTELFRALMGIVGIQLPSRSKLCVKVKSDGVKNKFMWWKGVEISVGTRGICFCLKLWLKAVINRIVSFLLVSS